MYPGFRVWTRLKYNINKTCVIGYAPWLPWLPLHRLSLYINVHMVNGHQALFLTVYVVTFC